MVQVSPDRKRQTHRHEVLMNLSDPRIKPHLKPDLIPEFSVPRTDMWIKSPPHLFKSLLKLAFLSLATEFLQPPV